ncbi:uncharacterized protein Bfra_002336 [Botrytis fragariae]|uniref:F-box domain-containing protein n=1 Tax=Botrytis fragariae TaxID=1964551 RepID=A0A8H6EL61_9HELO|nr:uncharacterized protein Bfra_002336 [Botrytis fragariae]KAF5875940.1 hypothetical protein Bfra_002336 [Botrytis fragariae]
MDFSNGLGISFGTNHSESEELDGNYEEAIESDDGHRVHYGQQMEDNGETSRDQASFESQLAHPEITSRPNISYQNQFTPINQASRGAQAQSHDQPYQYSRSNTSFHPLEKNGHLEGHMNAILAAENDYGQKIPQSLQFGADPQFNNHDQSEYGFQDMSTQNRMDTQHGFEISGMQSQQLTQNNNQQYMSPAGMQHQEDPAHSPSYNLQTYRNLYRNQEDFSEVSDCLSLQPKPGCLRPSRFRSVRSNTNQMQGNQLGNQAQNSSSARQGSLSNRNKKSSGRAPGKKGGAPEERYWNGFDTHRSMWPVQHWIIENILPGSCISHFTPAEQEGVITMMQSLGLDNWPITCNEDIQKFMDHVESIKSNFNAKQARLRAEAGLPELPPPEENQNTQEGDEPPLQPTSSFPDVSPNYVLTSDHGEPVFGQDPRDYRLVGKGHSHHPDDRSFIPVGSEQEVVASHKVSAQELNSQFRPPPLITQHFRPTFQSHYGMQNQRGYPLIHPSNFLHPSMDQGMNRPLDFSYQNVGFNYDPPQQYHHRGYASQTQQYHHHGQPFEYSSFHGYSPHHPHPNLSNTADQNSHPAPPPETIEEYEEDDEQQEEVTGTESQSQTAKQEYGQKQKQEQSEPPRQEDQAAETECELDSDGWSIHPDEMRSPPPNIFSTPRPANMPPSPPRPPPRFPSNEINPHGARNKPPPIIGPGNRVWSIAPGAFDDNGVIRDWDKAKRREIGEENCGCRGLFHGNGKGFYYVDGCEGERVWCDGGEGEEEIEEEGEDEDDDEDEGEEDEQLRGVPKWVKQALTHGPELDKNEERRKEVEYRAMMARKVKEILARKKGKERGEIPGFGFDRDFDAMDVESLFDDTESCMGYDANHFDPKSFGKGKRKARTAGSDDDLDEGSPVKKWKGKGRAAESDEELDEQEVARKYANKEKNMGKGKGKVFEFPKEMEVEDYLFGDSAETARWAEGLGLRSFGNEQEWNEDNNDHLFEDNDTAQGGYDTTRYPNNSELENETATADPELAATGIILPATFPNPSHPSEEDLKATPRPAPYLSLRNPGPFNIFQSLLLTPEIILEFILHLSPKTLLTLYSICRPFHTILSHWMAHSIKSIVKHQAPYSYTIYPFYLYRELSIPDPLGTLNSSGQIRRVPSLKYHQMVLHRCRVVRDILASLARQHLRCPPGTNHSLKKVWFLMDLSTTLDRVRLIHNRTFFTDQDLYNIQHFIVKLDMRLNCPTDGPGSDFLRKLMLGQRGLTPLFRLLTRTAFTDLYELYQYSVRYSYTPLTPAPDLHLGLFDVPEHEIGIAHLEGWGKGSKHLMRIDELVMREATRRELGFKEHIVMMLLWGYVDPLTGENLQPSREEMYMSDGEGEEAESEGDPWEGTGMNMQRLEQVVLGRAEGSDEDEDEDDEQEGEEEWEDENDFQDDPWL